jgi:hypothetical protein
LSSPSVKSQRGRSVKTTTLGPSAMADTTDAGIAGGPCPAAESDARRGRMLVRAGRKLTKSRNLKNHGSSPLDDPLAQKRPQFVQGRLFDLANTVHGKPAVFSHLDV